MLFRLASSLSGLAYMLDFVPNPRLFSTWHLSTNHKLHQTPHNDPITILRLTPSTHRPSACIYPGVFFPHEPQHQRHSIQAERSMEVLRIFSPLSPLHLATAFLVTIVWIFYWTTLVEELTCEQLRRNRRNPWLTVIRESPQGFT